MGDSKSTAGNSAGQRINTNQPHELRGWAKKYGVTEEMLRAAVAKVGNQASDVERHLKDKVKR